MKNLKFLGLAAVSLSLTACGIFEEASKSSDGDVWTFGQDLALLKEYDPDCVLLGQQDSFLAVSAKWQARVLTSTLEGADGMSLGWFNRSLASSGKEEECLNKFGGEDRFLIGPEGGEMSLFFPAGALYTAENWKAPKFVSTEPWTLVDRSATQAKFQKTAEVENAKGARFKVSVEREVSFIPKADAQKILGIDLSENVQVVAFQSLNKLTNIGDNDWNLKYGMVNMSVQSCFNANRTTAVFIPYKKGDVADMGDILKSEFFAASESQYVVEPDYIKFKVDAKKIEEIGVNAKRSKGIAISYDGRNGILTVTTYLRPALSKGYMPSSWRRNDNMGDGDAVSVYNNGPIEQGAYYAMPFYEISTHSPALALAKGKSQFHLQRTFHFKGSEYELGKIAYALTGISMKQIRGED